MPTVIERIAQWAAGCPVFNARCRERAHHAITDTLGCMIAGRHDGATQAIRRWALVHAIVTDDLPGSSLIGGGRALPAVAACLNATAAHALDYDDNFRPAISHPSAVLVPALLAVAQMQNATGRQLVDAYLIGLEAQALVGEGVNPNHYTLGWHATSTVGVIGSACGVAWLMGLEERGIARAMSLATSMAAGPKGQFGTLAKPLHAGLAARNAVEAAQLAATKMSGRLDILECSQGFMELYGGAQAPGWGALREGRRLPNNPHSIESEGVLPKRHPCCGSTHQVVDAVLALKSQYGFTAQEVVAVETRVGIANARNLAYPEPRDEMQARFSMPYCVALALVQERLSLADFTPEAILRAELRALMPLVSMQHYSAEQEAESPTRLPHWVAIRLRDGRLLEAERHNARGSIDDPFDDGDRWAKFSDCCLELPPSRRDELYRNLSRLDAMSDLDWLSTAFASSPQVAQLGN